MSRKSRHNAKVRTRILDVAGRHFRQNGFRGTRIDDVMQAAGLTRGAFYAHFVSKQALYVACLRESDPLLHLLKERSAATEDSQMLGASYLFQKMLEIGEDGVPTLLERGTETDTHAGPEVTEAFTTSLTKILEETGKGADTPEHMTAKLCATLGALTLTRACRKGPVRDRIIRDVRRFVASH